MVVPLKSIECRRSISELLIGQKVTTNKIKFYRRFIRRILTYRILNITLYTLCSFILMVPSYHESKK